MKVLNLLRHAKSSWSSAGLEDRERPLNDRGRKACVLMAPKIEQLVSGFDYVVASPAVRAQETIDGIANVIGFSDWYTEEHLYTFDWRELERCVSSLADTYDEALVVGHNPAITEFCNYKTDARIDNVPTCGFARIRFAVDSWQAVAKSQGQLLDFITPR